MLRPNAPRSINLPPSALSFCSSSNPTSRPCSLSLACAEQKHAQDQFAMSSSPAPAARSSPTAPTALAFLVHSPTTVANSLPPDVDNKPLARQKRRRTRYARNLFLFHSLLARDIWDARRVTGPCAIPSPIRRITPPRYRTDNTTLTIPAYSKEDEDILKAEYQRNPKPDKALRMEIASKVALGEKEVQVGQSLRDTSHIHILRDR
jgi:hypothetical protein